MEKFHPPLLIIFTQKSTHLAYSTHTYYCSLGFFPPTPIISVYSELECNNNSNQSRKFISSFNIIYTQGNSVFIISQRNILIRKLLDVKIPEISILKYFITKPFMIRYISRLRC